MSTVKHNYYPKLRNIFHLEDPVVFVGITKQLFPTINTTNFFFVLVNCYVFRQLNDHLQTVEYIK